MKKFFHNSKITTATFMLLISFFSSNFLLAQSTANYTFATAATGSLALDINSNAVDLTTGATTRVAASADDTQNTLANIGFDFWFMGTLYTQFSASDNGMLSLGAQPGTTTYALPNATTATISPFGNDLRVGTDGVVRSKVVGTAPNRCLVVEWSNAMIRYLASAAPGTGTFQSRIYETTGVVEFVYGAMTTNAATPAVYYVGFSNNTTVNRVVTVNTAAHTASTSATVTSNSYTASSTITDLNSASNGSRRFYKFSQTAPTAPTGLSFTNVAATSMTLNWTDAASNELGYVIYSSTDNVNFTFIGQLAAGSTSSNVTGLTSNTVYYYKVYAVREGALSTALTGSQITLTEVVISSGNSSWTPPSCVTSITVETYGAGGGGGSSNNGTARGGSGGGGGAYAKGTHTVAFGSSYFYNVGTGGSGGPANSTTAPTTGGQTWFRATAATNAAPTTNALGTLAIGGGPGVNNSNTTPTNGGTTAASLGNVTRVAGLAGTAGGNNGGGAGGDSANSAGAGGAGSNSADGTDGTAPGGGGGGSDDDPVDKGGNGGAGQIIISYLLPTSQSAIPVITGSVCSSATSISGTSTEANATIIEVFKNGVSQGTTTVTSNAWTKTGLTFAASDVITATATSTSPCKRVSNPSTSVIISAMPASGTLTPTPAAGTICAGLSVSATATAGSGGAGTIVDELEYNLSGGTYTTYVSGTSISTTGQNAVSIRTRRTATGSGCTSSSYNTVTWTVNAVPAPGTLTPNVAAGPVCSGTSVSATATAGSGGAGTIVDELERSLSGGAYAAYTSGTAISTTGQTSVSIRTRRTATGGGCTTSAYNTVTWTVNAIPTASVISGTASICSGSSTNLQVAITGGLSPYSLVYSGGSVGSYVSGTNISVSPTSSTTYTITSVTDANGCLGTGNTGSAVVTLTTTTTTNGGVSWNNGTPTSTTAAVYDGSTGTISSDISACSLRLTNNATVTVASGTDVNLSGAITVDSGSTFTLNNNANLIQGGTTNTNSGNIVVKRNSSALKRLDYTLWSSPVTGQGLYSFSPFTFGNRFYVYRTNTNFYNNADVGFSITGLNPNGVNGTDSNNVPFDLAKGYLIRMPWDHPTAATIWNATFTGVPNNGDITYNMTNGGSGFRFNLVGNPYPSPISMTTFVTNNSSNITGTLYFWRETNNNTSNNAYCSWAGGTFTTNSEAQVYDPSGIIRTGQGFIVEALGASTTLDFKNGQRSSDNSNQFFRATNAVENNRFWLNLTNTAGAFSQMAAGYMTDATDGVDIYDGKNINTGNVLLNSIINNTDYTIQGKALPFNVADVIPLSCKITDAGQYTITIDHVDGLFTDGSQAIYLKDNLTATEHDLQTGGYIFSSNAGTFNNRFEIIYQSQLGTPTFTVNSVIIYSQNNGFVVNSGNTVMSSIKVFDIRGRLIEEKKDINTSQTTIKGGLANEVMLVQITSEDGIVVTRKVIR